MNKAETKTGFEKLQKPSRMRTVLEVEKPKESKQTFKRLLQYFVDERKLLIGLLLAVTMGVLCNVYAPKLQSQAIDSITQGAFGVTLSKHTKSSLSNRIKVKPLIRLLRELLVCLLSVLD